MKKLILLPCLLFICSTLVSQTDINAKLKRNLVTVENGNYTIDNTQLLTFSNGASIQYQTSASGSQDLLSRDVFIDLYSSVGIFTLVSILQEAQLSLDDVEFKELEEPDGTPDIKVHFKMTAQGLEMAITTEDGTDRETITWEEFFEGS